MITESDVLLILHNDNWFTPSRSEHKKTIKDYNGNIIEVAESYYKNLNGGGQIIIRVSNHGTSLKTWVKRKADPTQSSQNLSVVFSNEPVTSQVVVEPIKMTDRSGNEFMREQYFVVEQYVYRMDSISKGDFQQFLKKIKALDDNKVFKDPLKRKPAKRALRTVLEPEREDGTPIPPSTNPVHPRQQIVATNKDYEVDAQGNIIKDNKNRSSIMIEQRIRQMIYDILREEPQRTIV